MGLSPMLSALDSLEEIPLPLLGTEAVRLLLAHCEEYHIRGRWRLSQKRLAMSSTAQHCLACLEVKVYCSHAVQLGMLA